MLIINDLAMQRAYESNPKEFTEGYEKAKAEPQTATVANSNPYDIATEYQKWNAWQNGFFNYPLSRALEDFASYLGEDLPEDSFIKVGE